MGVQATWVRIWGTAPGAGVLAGQVALDPRRVRGRIVLRQRPALRGLAGGPPVARVPRRVHVRRRVLHVTATQQGWG